MSRLARDLVKRKVVEHIIECLAQDKSALCLFDEETAIAILSRG